MVAVAITVDIPFSKKFHVPAPRERVFAYFADLPSAIPGTFPGIAKFEKTSADVYLWEFEPVAHGAHVLAVRFATRYSLVPPVSITLVPAPIPNGKETARLTGSWRFEEAGGETAVAFESLLQIDLPVPALMRALVAPLAQRELGRLFARYTDKAATAARSALA